MKRAELKQLVDSLLEEEMRIFEQKGEEYTIGNAEEGDALFNFKQVADLIGISPKQVFAVYWLKHVFSILNYVKQGKTFSEEGIIGRINDVRNYPVFLAGLIQEDHEEAGYDKAVPTKDDEEYVTYDDGWGISDQPYNPYGWEQAIKSAGRHELKEIMNLIIGEFIARGSDE